MNERTVVRRATRAASMLLLSAWVTACSNGTTRTGDGGSAGAAAGSAGGTGGGGADAAAGGAGTQSAGSDGGAGSTGVAGNDAAAPDVDAGADQGTDAGSDADTDSDAARVEHIVILHTNDLHSYLQGHSPETDFTPATTGDDQTIGGFSRLATAVGAAKAQAAAAGQPVLLLDAGDFMMGTLFSFLGTSAASELKMMDSLGYDATTLGNHEFDWTPAGLAGILKAAGTVGVKVPIVASNIVFDATSTADDALEAFKDPGPIKSKLVKMVGNVKVGIFGLLGKDAATLSPSAKPVTFEDIATAAARVVADLRQNDKVDVIIALSHSGIDSSGHGEDQVLATKVPDIDVIVSGHTHDVLTAPAKVGKTLIVTAGAYGEHLGKLALSVKPGTAGVALDGYTLIDIDDHIKGDPTAQAGVDAYITGLDSVLTPAGLGYRKVIAKTAFDLPRATGESQLGDAVTDAYRAVTSALQPTAPPDIAVEANGHLRSAVAKGQTGQIWFADLFRAVPLGIGPDGKPGYPLVTFYLDGKSLHAGMELDAAGAVVSNDYFLQLSGMTFSYDATKPLFQRVTAMTLVPPSGATHAIDPTDTTHCYKVVATYAVGSLLGVVSSLTGGALSVNAKESDCTTPVTDFSTHIVDAAPTTAGLQELKQWQAVTSYFSKLPDADADGTPDVPAVYGAVQGRIGAP